MRQPTDERLRSLRTNWPKVGPLGRSIGQVFSNLVYQTTSGPLTFTVWCNPETIIILADTHHFTSHEIDITVAEQTLFLHITPDEASMADDEILPDAWNDETNLFSNYAISLPFQVDINQIDAGFENNLLHIHLPCLAPSIEATSSPDFVQ